MPKPLTRQQTKESRKAERRGKFDIAKPKPKLRSAQNRRKPTPSAR